MSDMPSRQFFEYYDITDPNPWYDEHEDYYDGAACPLCGEEFRRGEEVLEIGHLEIGKGFFVIHSECLEKKYSDAHDRGVIDRFLDDAGFDVRQGRLD